MSLLHGGGITGDIWSTGAFATESPLKDLLDSDDYTLEQLLVEDELLQELRGQHPQLIEYFSTEEAVTVLLQYLVADPKERIAASPVSNNEHQQVPHTTEQEPGKWLAQHLEAGPEKLTFSENDPINRTIRFPYMSCEIICCEMPAVVATLVDGHVKYRDDSKGAAEEKESSDGNESEKPRRLLDLFFSLLYTTEAGKLDDYRAGYFEKILSMLFRKRPKALGIFINEGGERGTGELVKAMFTHLYSHSIMQIVQRLLLPHPLQQENQDDDDDNSDSGELILNTNDGPDIEEDGEDDTGEKGFRCNWSEFRQPLDHLLHPFIGEVKTTFASDEEEERHLNLCENSSEVLITIIQNSPLNSQTLLCLTGDPILKNLVDGVYVPKPDEEFSRHETTITAVMNVLESLILQLGGYGSVGTISLLNPDDEDEDADDNENSEVEMPEIADLTVLLTHIPQLLNSLSALLQHPSCVKWKSPMQFSVDEPKQLLGMARLRIVRLLESLVLLGDSNVDALLCQSDCLDICLNLFWEFQWCSMLHQSVANLLVHVFEGANARSEIQEYFVVKCNLLGRLMDSFSKNIDGKALYHLAGLPGSENLSKNQEVIAISEDDVEAVLEQKEDKAPADKKTSDLPPERPSNTESREPPAGGVDMPPAQSFRLGYMGHVIIICQALVHACTVETDDEIDGSGPGEDEDDDERPLLSSVVSEDQNDDSDDDEFKTALLSRDGVNRNSEGISSEEPPENVLVLAKLISLHSLGSRWQEFVSTTLATETAIQSTPLGGFNAAPREPLHAHRTLGDDDDFDDGSQPPGMLEGGEVIHMDDNDLDIAASMMAGLSLGRVVNDDDSSGDENSYDSGGNRNEGTGGYMFDDPLGKNSGLGLALGNLGRYNSRGDSSDDGDDGSEHSSDEENDPTPAVKEAPVLNLFAGNNVQVTGFSTDKTSSASAGFADDPGWSNFANFNDAFGGSTDSSSPDFVASFPSDPASNEVADPPPTKPKSTTANGAFDGPSNGDFATFFGGNHGLLLDDDAGVDKNATSKSD